MADEDYAAVKTKQFANGDVYTGTWKPSGVPDGEGKYTWLDGSIYEGSWKDGVKHGIGKYTWPSGASFHGEWWEGAMQGVGTWESADAQCRYQGGWHQNVKHGLGRQVYGSGDVYEGLWKLGSHWGPGRYVYGDGNEYDGEWRAGRMHGHGTFVWRTGERYDGEWKDGRMDGAGVLTAADGSVYDGRWRRGRKHGIGIFRPAAGAAAAAAAAGAGHLHLAEGASTRPLPTRMTAALAAGAGPDAAGFNRVSSAGTGGGRRSSSSGAPPAAVAAAAAAGAGPGVTAAGVAPNGQYGGTYHSSCTAATAAAAVGGAAASVGGGGGLGLVGTAAAAALARRAGLAAVTSPILFPSLPPSAPDSPRNPQPSAGSSTGGLQPWSLLLQPPPATPPPGSHQLQPTPGSRLSTPGDASPAALDSPVGLWGGPALGGAAPRPGLVSHPIPSPDPSLLLASATPTVTEVAAPPVNAAAVNGLTVVVNGLTGTSPVPAPAGGAPSPSPSAPAAPGPGQGGQSASVGAVAPGGGGSVSTSGAAAPAPGYGNGGGAAGGGGAGGKLVFVRVYDKGRLVRETALAADDVEALMPGLTTAGRRGARDERGPYQLLRLLRGGAMAAVGGGRPRLGDTVTRAHHAYALMVALQLGIRYSVGRISHEPLPRSTSQDEYSLRVQQEFPRGGSEMTPVHPVEDFTWSDYAPVTFRRLRESFGLDASTYMLSLCSDQSLRHLASPGKSGSVFFLSQDERFFIKTMSRAEMDVLLSMLPAYHRHVERHPHTLLCRFFGVHCVTTPSGRKYRFVVMSNIFRTPLLLHRKYDLKGSTVGRTAGRPAADDPSVIFKDLDLDLTLRLEEGWRDRLLFQLRADCGLLAGVGVMDYSLLVGVHFRGRGRAKAAAANANGLVADGAADGAAGAGAGAGAAAAAAAAAVHLEEPSVHPAIRLRSAAAAASAAASNPSRSTRRDKDKEKEKDKEKDKDKDRDKDRDRDSREREHPNYREHDDAEERAQEYARVGERIHRLQTRLGLGEAAAGDLLELARSRMFATRGRCQGPRAAAGRGAAAPDSTAAGAATAAPASAAAAAGDPSAYVGGAGGGGVSVSVNDQLALSMGQSRVQLGVNLAATAVYRDGREEEAVIWFALIDILQPYNATKRLEHGLKSVIHSSNSISVTHPNAYASRFQTFMKRVFE